MHSSYKHQVIIYDSLHSAFWRFLYLALIGPRLSLVHVSDWFEALIGLESESKSPERKVVLLFELKLMVKSILGLDRSYLRLPGLHLGPGLPSSSSSQSAGLRPEHFSGLSVPNYGLAEMQRRLYMTQNENILRAMSNQPTVDPGASGSSRTGIAGRSHDQAGSRDPETTPSGMTTTTGFSPGGSAFTPVTPKIKKDNSQRYFSKSPFSEPFSFFTIFHFFQKFSILFSDFQYQVAVYLVVNQNNVVHQCLFWNQPKKLKIFHLDGTKNQK